jgi:hypothetical protein
VRQILPASADVLCALLSCIWSLTTFNRTPVASRAAIIIIQKSAFSSTIRSSVVFFSEPHSVEGQRVDQPTSELLSSEGQPSHLKYIFSCQNSVESDTAG